MSRVYCDAEQGLYREQGVYRNGGTQFGFGENQLKLTEKQSKTPQNWLNYFENFGISLTVSKCFSTNEIFRKVNGETLAKN